MLSCTVDGNVSLRMFLWRSFGIVCQSCIQMHVYFDSVSLLLGIYHASILAYLQSDMCIRIFIAALI